MGRRTFLALSTLAMTGLAGCSSTLPDQEGTVLGDIEITNASKEDQDVDLQVIRNGNEVYANSWTIESGGYHVAEMNWPESPASYEVKVRLDEEDWATGYLDDEFAYADCTKVLITIRTQSKSVNIGAITQESPNLDCEPQ